MKAAVGVDEAHPHRRRQDVLHVVGVGGVGGDELHEDGDEIEDRQHHQADHRRLCCRNRQRINCHCEAVSALWAGDCSPPWPLWPACADLADVR